MTGDEYLGIYLNDHRAGEAVLVRLAGRILRSNRSTPWASDLSELHEAIRADAATLDEVAEAAGVTGGSIKRLAAIVGVGVGRLKLNGHLLTYSPLSRVLELEALIAALELKRSMWATLGELASGRPPLDVFDPTTMVDRASAQQEIVRPIQRWAASELANRLTPQ